MVLLETIRLRLRELTVADAAFVLALTNDPEFLVNIGDKGIRSLDDAVAFVRDGSWTNQSRAGHGQFVVETRAGGEAVGVCGLLYREAIDVSDIGFALMPAWRGRGYALEAARALSNHGRDALGLVRITGLVRRDNRASIAVLEGLGMTCRGSAGMPGDDGDTLLYD